MNLTKRVDKLEAAIAQHLEESGEIRSDLKWLKKAVIGIYIVAGTAIATGVVQAIWR